MLHHQGVTPPGRNIIITTMHASILPLFLDAPLFQRQPKETEPHSHHLDAHARTCDKGKVDSTHPRKKNHRLSKQKQLWRVVKPKQPTQRASACAMHNMPKRLH
jgi:hypothetical protein